MHLSMHNWMRAESVEVTARRLAKYGYESIEISGEPTQYDTKEVRKVLKDNGIRCWGSVTLMLGDRNLLHNDEHKREDSVNYVKDCITMVKELDGYEVTVVPSTVGKIEPGATPDEEWHRAVESMKQVHDHAQKEGIRIAIEPINRFETYFINRGAQAMALAEATHPDCGVCLDTYHMNMEEEDPYQAMLDVGDRLVDFHVCDSNRMACGMGQIDWLKVIGTLNTIGYDGAVTVEVVAPLDRTPANPHPDAVETDPVDITPEQKKFIEDHGSSLISEAFYNRLVKRSAEELLPLI